MRGQGTSYGGNFKLHQRKTSQDLVKKVVFKSLLVREDRGLFAIGSCDHKVCERVSHRRAFFSQGREKANGEAESLEGSA